MSEDGGFKGVLDVDPHSRADREFRRAYRSNLGRKIENNLLKQASEPYLRGLLLVGDEKLVKRVEEILGARHGSGTASLMRKFTKLFQR